jgi:hypothetical protein
MYNMTEVDKIMAVENNNLCVNARERSKKVYKIECKKMDDLLIQYHQTNNIDDKRILYGDFVKQKNEVEFRYESMQHMIKCYEDKVFDGTMMKKQRFSLINEELIQKAMSPARLTRHLELGGDIEDF